MFFRMPVSKVKNQLELMRIKIIILIYRQNRYRKVKEVLFTRTADERVIDLDGRVVCKQTLFDILESRK